MQKIRYRFLKESKYKSSKDLVTNLGGLYEFEPGSRKYRTYKYKVIEVIYKNIPIGSSGLSNKHIQLISEITNFYNQKHPFTYKNNRNEITEKKLFRDFLLMLSQNNYNSTDRNFANYFIKNSTCNLRSLMNMKLTTKEPSVKQRFRKFINQQVDPAKLSKQEYKKISALLKGKKSMNTTKLDAIWQVIKK